MLQPSFQGRLVLVRHVFHPDVFAEILVLPGTESEHTGPLHLPELRQGDQLRHEPAHPFSDILMQNRDLPQQDRFLLHLGHRAGQLCAEFPLKRM
ncbi:hypothetical protein D1872_278750 [compost metagenome]